MSPTSASPTIEAPTKPGFYRYSGGRQTMLFLLKQTSPTTGDWYVLFDNGSLEPCHWGYIEQALSVWDLVRIGAEEATPDSELVATKLVLADRELELLKLAGPCETSKMCRLHFGHSGPCDPRRDVNV